MPVPPQMISMLAHIPSECIENFPRGIILSVVLQKFVQSVGIIVLGKTENAMTSMQTKNILKTCTTRYSNA